MHAIRSTTIISVRRERRVALAGDGQVSIGQTIAKADAVKVRMLDDVGAEDAGVLVGFAGSAADSFALLERFEAKLKESPTNLMRAAIELAKLWRTDRVLRRLESLLIVADRATTLMISGQGDVIEPSDGVCTIGSGGPYALAAARALLRHTDLSPAALCREALLTAGEICVFSNTAVTVVELDSNEGAPAREPASPSEKG
ncbi:MAG: ATP-dependent protease subunit HslV [Planctomycetota bacterium]|nr:ATP-dependent protease subunit HslV [Planctomycetota bacterium]MCZ6611147.1 ATP-dependent protease subunit HslV [Planctomycetota bacterium]MCZ6736322.1 ATP-dependent protease subunit HslV [Planctomycetota bacterium]